MERVSFEIVRQDVADALHAEAAAHGRSVDEEVAALVERTYAAKESSNAAASDDWVSELVALAREINLPNGIEPLIPPRLSEDFEPPRL